MKSVMTHNFSQVPQVQIPRSQFDRSHGHKMTFNVDDLVPFYVDEVIPGDTFNLQATMLARLATPIAPIMDNLYLDTFFFFVPFRLVWDHWINFMGEKDDPDDTTEYTVPKVAGAAAAESLWDYFGLPIVTSVGTEDNVSALPFRAFHLIYNQWFRDQNLIEALPVEKGDGPDDLSDYVIPKRAKRHDYFTSALPWPQKGDAVELPLGTSAPCYGTGKSLGLTDGVYPKGLWINGGVSSYGQISMEIDAYNKNTGATVTNDTVGVAGKALGLVPKTADPAVSGIYADLSSATAATINSLREAFQLQRMLERDARSGNRYVETIRAHFGVTSPDFRLQRCEYLGGSSHPININPVQQTAPKPASGTTTPLGTLGAYGIHSSQSGFSKSFTEHGIVIGIINSRADLTYQQGINRMWNRQTKYDFYWPALAHLGEQEVLMKEIYATMTDAPGRAQDEEIFGYQERYAEYRYKPSEIVGQFRSNYATSLDSWHLSEYFGSKPELNQTFIESTTDMGRVLAVSTGPHLIADVFFSLKCARPMPVYSVPGLIDHF